MRMTFWYKECQWGKRQYVLAPFSRFTEMKYLPRAIHFDSVLPGVQRQTLSRWFPQVLLDSKTAAYARDWFEVDAIGC